MSATWRRSRSHGLRSAQTLRGRREQLLRPAYLAALRNDAVVNVAARRVMETPGQLPTFVPKAPGAP